MGQRFEYAITIALLLAIFFVEADSRKQHTEGLLPKLRGRHLRSSSSSPRRNSTDEPQFLPDTPGNVTAQLGGNASLPCRVKNLGDRNVAWIRRRDWHILSANQDMYTKDERFTVSHDPQTEAWNLTVRDVQERDAGRYQCELRFGGRQMIHPVDLVVKSVQPQFDPDTPANVTAQLGEIASLPCRITNLGDKSVSWIRIRDLHIMTVDRDTYIADERFTASHDRQTETWTLTVRDVQARDAGAYSCEVSTHPKMTHAVDLVVMNMQPQFDLDTPANVTAQLGESASLPCRITNLGDKSVSWIHTRGPKLLTLNQLTYTPDERFTASHDPQTETWTLTVREVQARDAGAYLCQVSTTPQMTHTVDLIVMKDLTTTTEKPPGLTTHRQDVSLMSGVPHSNICHDLEARMTKLGLHDAFLAQMQSVSSIVTFLEEKEARLVKLEQGHQPRGHTDPPSA